MYRRNGRANLARSLLPRSHVASQGVVNGRNEGGLMLLDGKNAVFYGVGDSLGGAVAKAFAEAGARVFLTARRRDNAEQVAREIRSAGGKAEVDEVDALVEESVNAHAARVREMGGSLDVSFNLINMQDRQGTPLIDMQTDDFVRPVTTAMRTQFLTATAAGRIMSKQKSGVILSLTATPGGIGYPEVGGFGPACAAIEAFSTNLGAELGPAGVRVVNLRSAGSPDSRPFREALDQGGAEVKDFFEKIRADTMLKQMPLMKDVANAAVFLASELAGKITGVTLDLTAGTTSALNYKTPSIAFVKK
jgi:NAD(P)-dependent dehydrogenase (short-subunit alcohol dehydrogenase family)